ncbi:flagellar biosynthesis protein FlhF [Comamonas endophytica]|uniref:Flagellar biosynthesis protein FlhF n=1 Tax=Comamonas endophytica TaxID=2949090 RepID=A0ABY6GCV5_9BURK|nr:MULTISPECIES: flagellar biosynthesis protein FlhF [unclassified Acidovorax]MCD2512732.1 flagellar biosynthesis protein FlhF [Acidovorax sp. D4N7]UYG52917.1 flagellar biosynthesis protein FlhF [Acidovorax sp. 5MLIR]
MNIRRFTAPTSREALAKARMAFGDGTLILSNRATPDGVEVTATAEDMLEKLDAGVATSSPLQSALEKRAADEARALPRPRTLAAAVTQAAAAPAAAAAAAETAASSPLRQSVEEDAAQLAMSTLSFQDYVRERMLRRRHESLHGDSAPAPEAALEQELPTFAQRARQLDELRREPVQAPAAAVARHNPLRAQRPASQPTARPQPAAAPAPQVMMDEIQSMKALIEDRFNTLAWLGQARQSPLQSNLMLKLIRAGYSPALSRLLLENLPASCSPAQAVRWLMDVLERNLRTNAHSAPIYEQGGVFALVGATGVGKTTTTAKLAAMAARIHGAREVGLITLDTYRVGAHEQLRAYGRMLGIVAHQAHDRAALQDLLGLLANKKVVLIDTTGVAPRDPRKDDILDVLDLPGVQRMLVLNASSQGDSNDEVLNAFKAEGCRQVILSKVDEAVKLGPSIDTLVRHQMQLCGVTNGQRVPEDWEAADAHQLVAASMRTNTRSAFDPKAIELDFFFTQSSQADVELDHA